MENPPGHSNFIQYGGQKKYPPDVELDSRILQLYHDHNVFGEKKFAGTQMRYTNAWKDDIEMYHNFVEDSSGMYDDDL